MSLDFEIHRLGWFSFEELCRTICRDIFAQEVEAFSRGPDGGRDGAFTVTGESGNSEPAVLQCKHFSKVNHSFTMSDFSEELSKVGHLVEKGRCDHYFLFTNAKVSAKIVEDIGSVLKDRGVKNPKIFSYETICEILTERKHLRSKVPRLYGLGDLTEILDERSYLQAQAVIAMMHEDLARLVPVEAHSKAYEALRDQRFVLLIGPPGSGKTSIAGSLAMGAIDSYRTRLMKLLHPRSPLINS